ncbi:lysine-specific demethylase 4C-like [Uloborus diversus]|uniref:lysine-specific demethylase 4C-like n=1 Tax=Uloborus diversus TaxID=327109 RepID=UPI00240A8A30|nr:lysine-specific demethylase 4C-like [Uloborus diversus]
MSISSASSSAPRIQVFRPSMEEFKDFSKYIATIESKGAHKAGLAKIIPPEGWCPRKSGYDDIDLVIPSPISQVITGSQGLYQVLNIQKKAMHVKEFKQLAESSKFKTPNHFDYEDLERKYWKNLTYNSPIYGADVSGSIYDKGVDEFNIQHLNTILDMIKEDYDIQIDGVNTAYLYFGMWKTTFAWHTEDMDLYSINYLHFGAPKSWYVVPPEHGRRLERLASGFFHANAQICPAFLRHKTTMISPHILKQYSIPFSKITQEPGEFMITFPYAYHSGFNHGFNCAESTNFALERWVEYGKRALSCTCRNDCVKICMDVFVRKFQPEKYEIWKLGKDVGSHPEDPTRQYAAPPPRKLELAIAHQREEKKKKQAHKLKRHPISKPEKLERKAKSSHKMYPLKSDDEETELYDVHEVISQKHQRKKPKRDEEPEDCVEPEDEAAEESRKDDGGKLVEGDLEMSVETDPDVDADPVPEVVDSPPRLTPFWDPGEGKRKSALDEGFEDVITSDIEPLKCENLEPKGIFEDYPLLKEAINSGTMTFVCLNNPPDQLRPPSPQSVQNGNNTEASLKRNLKDNSHPKSCKSSKLYNQTWKCEPGTNNVLKIKLLAPKKEEARVIPPTHKNVEQRDVSVHPLDERDENPTSVPTCKKMKPIPVLSPKAVKQNSIVPTSTPPEKYQEVIPVSISVTDVKPVRCVSPDSHILPDVQPENPKPEPVHRRSPRSPRRSLDSLPKDNVPVAAQTSPNVKVKRADSSPDSWAKPLEDVWQQKPPNFRAECDFNEKLASIPPHCAICVIFTPMYNNKTFPKEPSDVPSFSTVKMPAFYYGNILNSECLLDTSSLLRPDGTAPLLTCSTCKVCVHATCYGISMLPIGPWNCTRCLKRAHEAKCCLCVMRGGALKPTSDGRWAHVVCAILIPDTYFENTFTKFPVNVSKIDAKRLTLKCKYCLKSARKEARGVCVQCQSGRCYLPYHVTCGFMAGVIFEANNWPEPIRMICTKHAAARRKPAKRELTNVMIGEKVIAKHRNKRYYWANVTKKYRKDYYSITFEDNSHSSNTLPEDIVSRNVSLQGPPQINEKVKVKWTDDKIYNGIFKGSQAIELYVIEFDDGSELHLERQQIYAADEELPKEVQSKMSHSSDTKLHDFESETNGKRIRVINQKYS